ncbi:acetyl-CoA carboxylase biotin carboxyl carrier protein [Desulfuromonas sp. TF]|uniref:acetyl-CoA carboxylase biotin carboxyl carrier protein n=1 Tax=Desulfuromonas sp. TF TaxID=1232410 RepID=UPI00040EDE31|nr:acetyl-CoA carboxylase biotin carboxyl carrier protein [Desulfuromonas sp. TF]
MKIDHKDVQDILQLLKSSSFNEMHLQTERFSLTLRRKGSEWVQSSKELSAPNLLPPVGGPKTASAACAAPKAANAAEDGLFEIRTPMVGTFYRSPKPGAPPFVEVGSRVEKETVVAIVETMKLMNSVHAGVCGKVLEICLEDAQLAHNETVLMRVQPEAL